MENYSSMEFVTGGQPTQLNRVYEFLFFRERNHIYETILKEWV